MSGSADELAQMRLAAWEHREARSGFEVAFFRSAEGELRIEGETAAVEGADAWAVRYSIALDSEWHTIAAHVTGRSVAGRREVSLRSDAAGRWARGSATVRAIRSVPFGGFGAGDRM